VEQHVKLLGVLYIILGVMGGMAALIVLVVLGGAAGILSLVAEENPEAWIAAPILGIVGLVLFFLLLILSIPEVIAGVGLLKTRPWARILTIVLSALNLIMPPFGTLIGIYGLWVLLSKDTDPVFASRSSPAL